MKTYRQPVTAEWGSSRGGHRAGGRDVDEVNVND